MDQSLRRLLRQAQVTGSIQDYAAFYAERARVDESFQARLSLAAQLGHPAAVAATGAHSTLKDVLYLHATSIARIPVGMEFPHHLLHAVGHNRPELNTWLHSFISSCKNLELYGVTTAFLGLCFNNILLQPWHPGFSDGPNFPVEEEIVLLTRLAQAMLKRGTTIMLRNESILTTETASKFFSELNMDAYFDERDIHSYTDLIQFLAEMGTPFFWIDTELETPEYNVLFLPVYCSFMREALFQMWNHDDPLYDVPVLQQRNYIGATAWFAINVNRTLDSRARVAYFWEQVVLPLTEILLSD